MTTPALTEADLREHIRGLCVLLGWRFFWTWNSKHSPAGALDLTLIKPPRVIFAELKTDKGKLTPKQKETLELLQACPSVEAYTWRPSQLQDIVDILAGR